MGKSLMMYLQQVLSSNNKDWLRHVLTGAGLGLVSISIFDTFIDYYQAKALANFGSIGAVTGLLGIAGIDKAISIVIGAQLASVYIKTFAGGLKIAKK